ncbi:hypothetical protein BJX62DRAFT_98942 [Aspergillus germanicus]
MVDPCFSTSSAGGWRLGQSCWGQDGQDCQSAQGISMAASDRCRKDSSPSGESRRMCRMLAGSHGFFVHSGIFPSLDPRFSRRDLTPEKRGRSSVVRLDACSAAETALLLFTEAFPRETTLSTFEDNVRVLRRAACPSLKPSRSTLQRTPLTGPSNASLNREHYCAAGRASWNPDGPPALTSGSLDSSSVSTPAGSETRNNRQTRVLYVRTRQSW